MAQQSSSAFLSESDAAEYLGLSKKTLQRWRFNHKGPTYAKLNNKLIRYHHADLDEWVNQQIVTHDQHGFI
jgi:excisionase family DNA binding protein